LRETLQNSRNEFWRLERKIKVRLFFGQELTAMLIDWKSFLPKVKGSVAVLAEAAPETVGAYRQVCAADANAGHLDAKTRELISLAVAVTTRSDGCIAAHTKAAIELGAKREEIGEALSVAIAMNTGAAVGYAARVMDAYTVLSAKD
jgi:AhpD family alkylhydroperoxidase